jgi:hypothetical protein
VADSARRSDPDEVAAGGFHEIRAASWAIVTLFAKNTQLLGDVLQVLLEHTVVIPGGPAGDAGGVPASVEAGPARMGQLS